MERGPQQCVKWPGVRIAFSFTTRQLPSPPGCPRERRGQGSSSPAPRASWGCPTPAPQRPHPTPPPRRPRPPRRAGPSPAPFSAAASARLPRTLAEAPGSARSAQSCSGGRMPSVSVSCYGNPDRGKFRIRSETEPRALPDPPLASRPGASVLSGPNPRPT